MNEGLHSLRSFRHFIQNACFAFILDIQFTLTTFTPFISCMKPKLRLRLRLGSYALIICRSSFLLQR
nr:MAG TPA: hypothetical protein [Caudoviricetes sp.]